MTTDNQMEKTMTTTEALADVAAERARQDAKWGEQNHPDGTGGVARPLMSLGIRCEPTLVHRASGTELADAARLATDDAAKIDVVTWTDILLEEVFEALAESDPAVLRVELIQVAAVATQWAEAIDRRAGQ